LPKKKWLGLWHWKEKTLYKGIVFKFSTSSLNIANKHLLPLKNVYLASESVIQWIPQHQTGRNPPSVLPETLLFSDDR